MDNERLREIENRLLSASRGPWHICWDDDDDGVAQYPESIVAADGCVVIASMDGFMAAGAETGMPETNAAFIAAAPVDMAYLLAEVRRLNLEER